MFVLMSFLFFTCQQRLTALLDGRAQPSAPVYQAGGAALLAVIAQQQPIALIHSPTPQLIL
jgi:hypothetical protein